MRFERCLLATKATMGDENAKMVCAQAVFGSRGLLPKPQRATTRRRSTTNRRRSNTRRNRH